MSDLVARLRDTGLHSAAQAADALEAQAARIAELESWKAAEDAHHHMLLSRIAALEADLAKARGHMNHTLQDHGRMLWRDDIEAHCPNFDLCSEYADNGLRCSPCAIKQSEAAGVEPLNLGKPYSPEEWRLKRQIDALEATICRLMNDLQAHKDALAQSEPKR